MNDTDDTLVISSDDLDVALDNAATSGQVVSDLPVNDAIYDILRHVAEQGEVDDESAANAQRIRDLMEAEENRADAEGDVPDFSEIV